MRAGRDMAGDFVDMRLHGLGVDPGRGDRGALPERRTNRAEQIAVLVALVGGLAWPRAQCAALIDEIQNVRDLQATLKGYGVSPTYVSEGALGTAVLYLDDRTAARCAELGVRGQHRRLRRSQSIINVELIKNKCKSYLVTGPGCAIAANNTMVCC